MDYLWSYNAYGHFWVFGALAIFPEKYDFQNITASIVMIPIQAIMYSPWQPSEKPTLSNDKLQISWEQLHVIIELGPRLAFHQSRWET